MKTRLGNCEICKKHPSKYTCPACAVHTCSLACNSSHKKSTDCDGLRSRTSFVRLSEFDELDLLSDVRLLEDIGRCVDKCVKDKTKRFSRVNKDLPLHLLRLETAAFHRGTKLLFLPQHFARHQNNTTFLNWKNRTITWRLQFTFLNAEMLTYYEERCCENLLLEEIVSKYLKQTPTTPKALQAYQKAGIESIDVLMKVERTNDSLKKFYKLNMKESLKDNLSRKTVIEFPHLFLVIKDFYTAKSVTEMEVDAKKQKITDYLQLGNHENEDSIADEKQTSSSNSSSSSDDDNDEDDELNSDLLVLNYSEFIK